MAKRINLIEQRRIAKEKAMPEVKKLVNKHGRVTIQRCLNTIYEHQKKAERLEELKGEVEKLESEL